MGIAQQQIQNLDRLDPPLQVICGMYVCATHNNEQTSLSEPNALTSMLCGM
jgi:hypothetical protein